MELRLDRAAPFVRGGDDGSTDLSGIVELTAAVSPDATRIEWSISNSAVAAVSVRSVGWVVGLDTAGAVQLWSNGYQSWSGCGVATLGVDTDPSLAADSFEQFRAVHHSDQRLAHGDELRSEQVCVVASGDRCLLVGWLGGAEHEGMFRLRTGDHGPELVIEAHLGGVSIDGGESRDLHPVVFEMGDRGQAPELLDRWARRVGEVERARIAAPYQVGWCSWYHYFEHISQESLLENLARCDRWPFDVFQLDDGFQTHIGDWLGTNHKFGSDLGDLASAIAAAGRRPGIWIAPFLAHPDSEVHRRHPEWIASRGGEPLPGWLNEPWGGVVNVLDTSNPAVLEHLAELAADLVDAGFTYLKLDFTFAPSFEGEYHDPTMTPAQRVRAGFDAIRHGAGEDAFILGCGAPLGSVVGVVDAMRVGPDVAPSWAIDRDGWFPSAYAETVPSTRGAWQSTLARSFMHRRLWINDPDCLMLRTEATRMTPDAVKAWSDAVAASGGMALVSDDLALLGDEARARFDAVIEVGRAVDDAARTGPAPACPDLLDHRTPRRLVSSVAELTGDPDTATSTLELHRPS